MHIHRPKSSGLEDVLQNFYSMSSRILLDVQQNLVDVQQKFYRTSSRPYDLGLCMCIPSYNVLVHTQVCHTGKEQHIFTHVFITKYMPYIVSNFEKEVAIYFHIFFEEDFLSFPLSFQALRVFQSSKFSLAKQFALQIHIYYISSKVHSSLAFTKRCSTNQSNHAIFSLFMILVRQIQKLGH